VIVDGTYEDAVAAASLAATEDGVAEVADVGTSPTARWVIDGYATLFAEVAAAVGELGAAGFAIGESGAAPLAGLHGLATDDRCGELRQAVDLGPASRVLLVATEGPTGVSAH